MSYASYAASEKKTPFPESANDRMPPGGRMTFKTGRRLFLTAAICVWIPGLLYTFCLFQPVYESKATVQVRNLATKAKFVSDEEQESTSSPSSNPVFNTIELLKSHYIRDYIWDNNVKSDVALQKKLNITTQQEWNKFYGDGRKFLKSNNPPGTDIIQLSFQWDDPLLAHSALKSALRGFRQASLEINQREYVERFQFLQERIRRIKAQLDEVRTQIADIKSQHQVTNVSNELENYAKYHMEYELASILASAESAQNNEKLAAYRRSLHMDPETAVAAVGMGGNPSSRILYEKLYAQKQQLSTMQTRYTKENPKVIELESAIKQTQADIRAEAKRLGLKANIPIVTDEPRGKAIEHMLEADSSASGSQSKSKVLTSALVRFEDRLAELPKIEKRLKTLNEMEASLSEALKTLDNEALDAMIRQDQTLSNVFIINEPDMPENAKFPTRNHLLLLSILGGLLAGLALVLVAGNKNGLQSVVAGVSPSVGFWPMEESSSEYERPLNAAEPSKASQ